MKTTCQLPHGRRRAVTIFLLLLSHYGVVLVRSTLVLHKETAVADCARPAESCAGYVFCAQENRATRNKIERQRRRRRRYEEYMCKLQKKVCERVYSLIKLRLRVKNADNPCNY